MLCGVIEVVFYPIRVLSGFPEAGFENTGKYIGFHLRILLGLTTTVQRNLLWKTTT